MQTGAMATHALLLCLQLPCFLDQVRRCIYKETILGNHDQYLTRIDALLKIGWELEADFHGVFLSIHVLGGVVFREGCVHASLFGCLGEIDCLPLITDMEHDIGEIDDVLGHGVIISPFYGTSAWKR